MKSKLENVLQKNQLNFRAVVNFNAATDKLFHLDFTAANSELALIDIADTAKFSNYINQKLLTNNTLMNNQL